MFVSKESQEIIDQLKQENEQLKEQMHHLTSFADEKKGTSKLSALLGWVMFAIATLALIVLFLNSSKEHPEVDDSVQIATPQGVEVINTLPSNDLVYTVQIGAFTDFDISGYADDLDDFYLVKNDGLEKVSLGNFSSFQKAQSFLSQLHELGFDFAYIVAYKNGEPIGLVESLNQD